LYDPVAKYPSAFSSDSFFATYPNLLPCMQSYLLFYKFLGMVAASLSVFSLSMIQQNIVKEIFCFSFWVFLVT